MCKANESIMQTVEDLLEVKAMIEELEAEAEQLTDKIKEYMGDEEVMISGTHKVS